MANYYYGINRGQNEYQAVVSTSTNTTDIEIFVNGTNILSRESVLIAIEKLENFILRQNFPPA